ncbi:MAG TPA: hypothetical protein VIF13_04165, partial [Hyphomicrobium sp.]
DCRNRTNRNQSERTSGDTGMTTFQNGHVSPSGYCFKKPATRYPCFSPGRHSHLRLIHVEPR